MAEKTYRHTESPLQIQQMKKVKQQKSIMRNAINYEIAN